MVSLIRILTYCNICSKLTDERRIMMAQKTFLQVRGYFEDCTISDVFNPEGEKIGHALEDVGRPANVKIPGETCIPESMYIVNITYSNKYKKKMIQLHNVTADLAVEKDGVKFVGVRVHGGNDVDDTEGCPLVAKNFDGDQKIWKSMSAEITAEVVELLKQGHSVRWCITSY